ncbi:hypothetical protein J7J84_06965 [bacterium]|nr:hypothetical protein [bacterium]
MKLYKMEERGYLARITPSRDDMAHLVTAIQRRLMDAGNPSVTKENRLQQAYQAVLQVAIAALHAKGYRLKSKPAHHVMAIESLEHTVGVDRRLRDYYQSLRKRRHHAIYDALISVSKQDLEEAIDRAEGLFAAFRKWLEKEQPELVDDSVWERPVDPG